MSITATIDGTGNGLAAGAAPSHGRSGVEQAIRQASQETGVDFAYLMEKAAVESSFQPDLKASTSSATGLYQFIDSTWLSAMKAHGAEHGLGQYADAIQRRADGGLSVPDPAVRKQILDLRKDPKISAVLAAELTKDNKAALETKLGTPVGATELYLAHFLGAAGAGKFLSAMRDNPLKAARDVVPDAASSNTAVFYDRQSGQPKTLAQVYDRFASKFGESSGDIVSSGRTNDLTQMIRGVAAGKTPMDALKSMPLTGYTMLALAALQTPDESKADEKTAFGSRKIGGATSPSGFNPVNDFRAHWLSKAS